MKDKGTRNALGILKIISVRLQFQNSTKKYVFLSLNGRKLDRGDWKKLLEIMQIVDWQNSRQMWN